MKVKFLVSSFQFQRFVTVIFISGMMLATAVRGADPGADVNLLKNPGFEESVKINTIQHHYFRKLLARSVEVEQGDAVILPAGWTPNSDDGWGIGNAGVFRYVEGAPGKEVFSGNRALFLACKGHAAVMDGGCKVYHEKIPEETGLQLNKPNRFSIYARGSGKLRVYVYTYDRRGINIYGKIKVTPSDFTLTNEWTQYEGTVEFTSKEVGSCIFVVGVRKGEVTVDDAAFYGEK